MERDVITEATTVVVSRKQVSRNVGDEAVILDDGQYFGLNPVGTRVWALIQEPRAVSDICKTIHSEYDVDADTCRRDVVDLLERLAGEQLIEVRP